MIFIYGTGTSRLLFAPLPTLACVHCGTQGQMSVTVFSRYVSLFWIPVFPFGKISVTVCNHCKQTLMTKEPLPESYQLPVQTVQQHAPGRLTNFALPLILLLGIVAVMLLAQLGPDHRRKATAAATAQEEDAGVAVGARYKMRPVDGQTGYALMQVTGLTNDTVYYKITGMLRNEPTPANATVALRDSIPSYGGKMGVPRKMWHFLVQGEGMFRPLTFSE